MECEEKNSLGLCEEKMVVIADALAYLIIEYNSCDMSSSLDDFIKELANEADMTIIPIMDHERITWDDKEKERIVLRKIMLKLLNTNINYVLETIFMNAAIEDYSDASTYFGILESQLVYNVKSEDIMQHETIKALIAIEPLVANTKFYDGYKAGLDKLKGINIVLAYNSYLIGHEYWRYLDELYFGTRTNDSFTVGNMCCDDFDRRYTYRFGHDVCWTRVGLCTFFHIVDGMITAAFIPYKIYTVGSFVEREYETEPIYELALESVESGFMDKETVERHSIEIARFYIAFAKEHSK